VRRIYLLLSLSIASIITIGCGDGGDDPFFSGVAEVDVSVTPRVIDVGETTYVEVEVDNLDVGRHPSFFLKVRYPSGLSYVPVSASILVNGESLPVEPDRVFLLGSDEYAVFFLSAVQFDFEDDFMVLLKLRGNASVRNGKVEVDPDVDDRSIPNEEEFDEANPEFNGEEGASIEVIG
jgi:hypothetical protein